MPEQDEEEAKGKALNIFSKGKLPGFPIQANLKTGNRRTPFPAKGFALFLGLPRHGPEKYQYPAATLPDETEE
jgi:hypothetical protein